jgi:DNA-binding beta-propeller fold protein YncE
MVQFLLAAARKVLINKSAKISCTVLLLLTTVWAADKGTTNQLKPAELPLEGGRKLVFERSFSTEKETKGKPGFWTKVLDVVAGEPEYRQMVRPYSIAVDSRGRVIVTDPGVKGVHLFDFERHKYKFIQRADKDKDPMLAPQCVAVDDQDNFYVTDSESGKIFVFDGEGKFRRVLGSLKGGEGYFKRPTGIAVDSAGQRIYVTDTLRDKIFVLDMQGQVMQTIGKHGTSNGEFYYPTELRLSDRDLVVVDAMNFRVQRLSRGGEFEQAFGRAGDGVGQMFRPKGVAVDSEGDLYIADALWGVVQVFDRQGQLLYYFGQRGTELGEFQLPAGIFIDHNDRVFVVDSYNRRVQVFRYYGLAKKAERATP